MAECCAVRCSATEERAVSVSMKESTFSTAVSRCHVPPWHLVWEEGICLPDIGEDIFEVKKELKVQT